MLTNLDQIRKLLDQGKALVLAGEEALLRQVPRGPWVGGTIPYFMSKDGGVATRQQIYVAEVPAIAVGARTSVYDTESIRRVARDTAENGYCVLILPAFSALHQQYALEAPFFDQMFLKPVAGWISGVHLDDLGKAAPLVFDGATGEAFGDRGVAMHVTLPNSHQAHLGVVNIFEPGDGDDIVFEHSGFSAETCLIGDERRSIVDYVRDRKLDVRLPLVADYMGTHVNVSIQSLEGRTAKFYAPVFEGVRYRWAKPIGDYPESFNKAIPDDLAEPVFSCNCILNYLYGQLENRHTGRLRGPMTFGEIGFQLLNQTLVHITITSR